MPAMIVFTSAKSRLMMPGIVMMSEIPCTAWRRMSSAMRNDSKKPAFCATASSFSLGITIVVSMLSISSAKPRSACAMRRRPSNANGLVTTATVRAPISLASEAMIGAAPVPVPPPRPVVTNTMSAPSRASIILSASSRAPRRPISGLAPAPRPLVSLVPNWIFTGARDICSACKSVLATTNSTPSTPAQIIRLTAFPPPPPTPITLIFAFVRGSSLNWILTSPSALFCSLLIHHTPDPFGSADFHHLVPALRVCAPRCFLKRPASPIQPNFLRYAPSFASNARSLWPNPCSGFIFAIVVRCAYIARPTAVANSRQSRHARPASGQYHSRRTKFEHASLLQMITHQFAQLLRAGFEYLGQKPLRHQPRRPVSHGRHFNLIAISHLAADGVAKLFFDLLCGSHRRSQSDGNVIGEMVSAHRHHARMRHHSVGINNHVSRSCADIGQAHAQLFFVSAQRTVRGHKRFVNDVVHMQSSAVRCGDNILRCAGGSSHHVEIHFQPPAHHSRRIAHSCLFIQNEFLWQQVQYFAIVRERD